MNPIIDTLNAWGSAFVEVAWTVLWQSSLLILLLVLLELLFRWKIRASIRYGLWLVVLLKLVLPPSFASPSSLAWWLRSAPPFPNAPKHEVRISYPTDKFPALSLNQVLPVSVRKPRLTFAAEALATTMLVGLGLCSFLAYRWRHVNALIAASTPASTESEALLAECGRLAGYRPRLDLRFTKTRMSPAVCGLWRPVILLPECLATQLDPGQLRAVLLHEIIHVRRRDVWANFAQSLIQIAYWWHPLLWLANMRIRRLREEAVDDAVILALSEDAEVYAPTLLEVARLALNRPMVSLGMVGILESRSALRQRIERLVNFTAPRRAGLSIGSVLAIAAFTAVAVPMGQAPPKSGAPQTASAARGGASDSVRIVSGTANYDVDAGTFSASNGVVISASNFTLHADSVQVDHRFGVITAQGHLRIETKTNEETNLQTRTFKLDSDVFLRNLRLRKALSPKPERQDVEEVLAGLVTESTGWKPSFHLFYNERSSRLVMQATPAALNSMENLLVVLNAHPPQVNVRVKFLSVTETAFSKLPAGAVPSTIILTPSTCKDLLHALEFDKTNANLIAEPQVTTLSGQQCQMQVVEVTSVVTNVNPQTLQPQVSPIPLGPTVDLIPTVREDGHTIQLSITPTLVEFLGYDEPTNFVTGNVNGVLQNVPVPRPQFRVHQMTAKVEVEDGQTVILFDRSQPLKAKANPGADAVNSYLLVLVTPTIIDFKGNRVHPAPPAPLVQAR